MHSKSSCSFTGHRPEKLPWGSAENDPRCIALKENLYKEVESAYKAGYPHFLTGMARGTDLYFCEAVLSLRNHKPDVTVEAVIPFPGQAERWNRHEQSRYHSLLEQCNFETMVQHHYSHGCMQRRNRYLVEHSSRILAVYNGKGGGTLYTLNYAVKQNLERILLNI